LVILTKWSVSKTRHLVKKTGDLVNFTKRPVAETKSLSASGVFRDDTKIAALDCWESRRNGTGPEKMRQAAGPKFFVVRLRRLGLAVSTPGKVHCPPSLNEVTAPSAIA